MTSWNNAWESDEGSRIHHPRLSLEDIISDHYQPQDFSGAWISGKLSVCFSWVNTNLFLRKERKKDITGIDSNEVACLLSVYFVRPSHTSKSCLWFVQRFLDDLLLPPFLLLVFSLSLLYHVLSWSTNPSRDWTSSHFSSMSLLYMTHSSSSDCYHHDSSWFIENWRKRKKARGKDK